MLVIEVQCCQNCERHNWCSRHNQAKYQQFSSSLQTRLQQFYPHLSYTKNQPPPHYSKKTLFSNLGFPIQSYYDEHKKQIAIFPRHGAFQITVNGILIFSKLQSNIWPNTDRIVQLVAEMRADIENGADIKKYSIDYRMNNLLEEKEKERNAGKEKKSVQFKISRRPKSNQFNGGSFATKGGKDQLGQRNLQKNRTVEVGSKPKVKAHRQSEVSKKSLIKLKIKKNQSAHSINNQQSTHSINNNQQIMKIEQQLPHFARRIEGNQSCLMLNKRLQQKKQILRQVKSQQLKSMANKGYIKLQKKSRKLVIQSNKNTDKKEQQPIIAQNDKVEQSANNGQQILFFKTSLQPQQLKQKRQQSQYQQSISNQRVFEANMIEVEDYQSQKQVNAIQSQKSMRMLQQNNEVLQQWNGNMGAVYKQDNNVSIHFIQIQQIKKYWQQIVAQIIQSIKLKSLEPTKHYQSQIEEKQQQIYESVSQNSIKQDKIQEAMHQKSMVPQKEQERLQVKCQRQYTKQVSKDPFTQFCELQNEQQEIQQEQKLIEQNSNEISNNIVNTLSKEMKDAIIAQKPQETHEIASSPLQYFQQIKTSNLIQATPSQSFTLDHMAAHDPSKNIQQLLIKQQSRHFSQELTNNILQNTRFLNEEHIKQVIQALQQNSYNHFYLNEDTNNSDDNVGIAFQLTKEQGFFEGRKQSGAAKLQQLKRLQEREKQEELQYSVYSQDPKERFIEGRESKVSYVKGMESEAKKIEEGHHSNQTIIEAQSSIFQPSQIVQVEGKEVYQQKQAINTFSQQKQPQERPASSQQLADTPKEQQENSLTPKIQQGLSQQQPREQNNHSQLQVESQKQPFSQKMTQNKESPQQKPIISSRKSIQKQNQPPSLKCLSAMEDAKNSQEERMLPNQTQTSISLSSQIRSQLSCLYYDIQARI